MFGMADMKDYLKQYGISSEINYNPITKNYRIRAIKGTTAVCRYVPTIERALTEAEYEAVKSERMKILDDIVQTILEYEIKNEKKEKENAMNNNNINWKVADMKIDSSLYDGEQIACKLIGRLNPITRFNPMTLVEDLEKKLNAPERKDSISAQAYAYLVNDMYSTKKLVDSAKLPVIKKVIFNDPATIVIWADETKTVVKAENEVYDPEKGLAMAITKKALGNEGKYYDTIKKWLDTYEAPVSVEKSFAESMQEAAKNIKKLAKALNDKKKKEEEHDARWLACQRLNNALYDPKATKKDLPNAMCEARDYLESDS